MHPTTGFLPDIKECPKPIHQEPRFLVIESDGISIREGIDKDNSTLVDYYSKSSVLILEKRSKSGIKLKVQTSRFGSHNTVELVSENTVLPHELLNKFKSYKYKIKRI